MKNMKTFIALCLLALCARPVNASLPHVEFSTVAQQVDGTNITLTQREQARIERFLTHVFPTRQMRREAGCWDTPKSRHVTYSVISQEGLRFVLAGYNAEWKQDDKVKQSVNMLAIYRIEDGAPNQVWRGRPWMATYDGLQFSSAKANAKSRGEKNIVLFQEGGSSGNFGLASVFSFHNELHGLIINDLTPSLPCLRASTRFPFRPLYGRQIGLRANVGDQRDLILSANDEQFKINNEELIAPHCAWKYKRGRFERLKFSGGTMTDEMGIRN
jgi:hypothetical protein